MPDNKVDSITVIGDGLNAVNFALSNISPGSADFDALKAKRDEVRQKFDILVEFFFKDSAKRFVDADGELATVNGEVKAVLDGLKSMQEKMDVVTRFVTAIDTFISAIFHA